MRVKIWFWILAGSVLCLVGLARPSASPSYIPYRLFELVLLADQVVVGTIEAVQGQTFDLRVERTVVGHAPTGLLRVSRFVDWACATRWSEYERGQSVLLFLHAADRESPFPTILGAGGEGEMPLVDGQILVRGFRLRGRRFETLAIHGGQESGSRADLDEFCAAVAGFRQVATAVEGSIHGTGWVESIQPRRSEEAMTAFAATSQFAHQLVEGVRSTRGWRGSIPAAHQQLDPSRLRDVVISNAEDRSLIDILAHVRGATGVGDLDGDGLGDVVLDAPALHGGAFLMRHPQVICLNRAGEIRRHLPLMSSVAGPSGWALADRLESIGDIDRNGFEDLFAASYYTEFIHNTDGKPVRSNGDAWVLFLGAGGVVQRARAIRSQVLSDDRELGPGSRFGCGIAGLGDLDGDGAPEVAIGMSRNDVVGHWIADEVAIVSLDRRGAVRRSHVFTSRQAYDFSWGAGFNGSLEAIGDVDGDGVTDLAVGASDDDDGGWGRGAVWILMLNRSGTVRATQKISDWEGGFDGFLRNGDQFGSYLIAPGDLNGDGTPDLLVGACGALWTLSLDATGRVRDHRWIETTLPDRQASVTLLWCAPRELDSDGARSILCRVDGDTAPETSARLAWLRIGSDGLVRVP